MSALALVLHGEGYKVQGSDLEQYSSLKRLEEAGITLLPFSADNIEGQVVIAGTHFQIYEELVSAREKGVEVVRYHKFLGELLKVIRVLPLLVLTVKQVQQGCYLTY